MNREEAIEIIKNATVWNDKERAALAILIPELRESEHKIKSAIDLIAEERERQISKGFNWKHDDEHDCHQLSDAAIVYAAPAPLRYQVMNWWPWDKKWLKEDGSFTTEGRIRELVKAGALIVAEIERLQRTVNNVTKPNESEDERMLRKLMNHLDWHSNNRLTHEECDELRAWLEKQKDLDKMIVVSPDVWDNAITDAYENGKKDGEKQKEQKPAEWDEYTKINLDRALQIIKKAKGTLQGYQTDDGIYECDKAIECLEHFLYRGLEIEKPAEWSEDDDWKRKELIQYLEEKGDYRTVWMTWLKSLPEKIK